MKIYAIKDRPADTKPRDLDQFKADLQGLSERHGIHLVSIGAMSTVDATGPAYIAV